MSNLSMGSHILSNLLGLQFVISVSVSLLLEDAIRCLGFIYGLAHTSVGDWSYNSTAINGWLRNLLWSQSAQVIQSYGTSISGYGFSFLGAHFVWAFSFMFLYSGRGYWQELIESILWSHTLFKLTPTIQPRALSINQGRAVGLVHYFIGGVGCSWAFFISRLVALA